MVPLDRTLEIVPTPRDSVLDMVLPTLPLPLPLDAPLYPTTEGNGTAPLHHVLRYMRVVPPRGATSRSRD